MTVRVLVVEPSRLVGEALACLLERFEGAESLGWVQTPAEAISAVRKKRADVVVWTVTLPLAECLAGMRRWRVPARAGRILALAERHESLLARQLLQAGASGVAAKTDSAAQWEWAIREAARDDRPAAQTPSGAAGEGDADSDLTHRQRQILQAVANGMTSRQIAGTFGITVKTVEAHRHHICRRLRVRSIAALTKYALREGLTDLGI
ncbi:MAG: response regulator transcription factor [Planctomycetota bacterium]|nr:response regulator transcription factor [Planctomycetota bacterium]